MVARVELQWGSQGVLSVNHGQVLGRNLHGKQKELVCSVELTFWQETGVRYITKCLSLIDMQPTMTEKAGCYQHKWQVDPD